MWYVYILRSLIDNNLYVGSTNNVHRRLAEHNSGKVDSTKGRIPFGLEAYIAAKDQVKAIELEQYFKTDRGKLYYRGESFSLRSFSVVGLSLRHEPHGVRGSPEPHMV